jgi:tetratricopeptide (TPR) repeat protein
MTVIALSIVGLTACVVQTPSAMGPAIAKLNTAAQQAMAQGNTATAVARLESALELAPNQPELSHNLAAAYLANHNYGQAATLFEALANKAPDTKAQLTYITQAAQAHQQQGNIAYDALMEQKANPLPAECQPALEPEALPTGQDRRLRHQSPAQLAQLVVTHYTEAKKHFGKVVAQPMSDTTASQIDDHKAIAEILATLDQRLQQTEVVQASRLSGGRA